MATHIDLVGLNTEAAEAIASQDAQFNGLAADLVLRNLACATERLDLMQFSRLSRESRRAVASTVEAAKALVTSATEDTNQFDHETDAEYQHRLSVLRPLNALQAKVHNGDFDADNNDETTRLKAAVRLAGTAFAAIITESADNPVIRANTSYFWGNTISAARRAKVETTAPQT